MPRCFCQIYTHNNLTLSAMTRALTAAGSAVIIKVKKARLCANTRYSPRNGYKIVAVLAREN